MLTIHGCNEASKVWLRMVVNNTYVGLGGSGRAIPSRPNHHHRYCHSPTSQALQPCVVCDYCVTPVQLHLHFWLETMSALAMLENSTMPFAKVSKAFFLFNQIQPVVNWNSVSVSSAVYGKLTWTRPNVSHEWPLFRSHLTKCWPLLTGIQNEGSAFACKRSCLAIKFLNIICASSWWII